MTHPQARHTRLYALFFFPGRHPHAEEQLVHVHKVALGRLLAPGLGPECRSVLGSVPAR